ncbi:MAG TPA: hypothetical protein VFQ20_02520 [Burkholderiaceae bacterium]|nr:hypothetical protein [Burkholderiaceae bacterium]
MPPPDPHPALIDGRSEFTHAVRDCLRQAVRRRARAIFLVDADFLGWPLDDPDVLAALDAWVRLPKRRMLIVAGRFDALPRVFPRFARWRVTWAHAVECRATDVETSQIPTLLLADAASLQLADRARWRGHLLADDREVADWREVVDVLVQRSEPDFGASTLGL